MYILLDFVLKRSFKAAQKQAKLRRTAILELERDQAEELGSNTARNEVRIREVFNPYETLEFYVIS